ncbi:MAG: bifunctional hydroxymethylpyrimidine kinase/phosphomethylpyrimidine kinase [Bacteroidetes bacterium]|nr:bifunctional hydroxymethylpyrimidine kinase/phosphomethylpyrimidine kinase [Bacteroidota bacterium]
MIAIIAPSLDDKRIYPIHSLTTGAVHRSRVVLRHASGKGANAARAVARRGASVMLSALAGEDMAVLLEDQLGYIGVRLLVTSTQQATRSCITVLEDDGGATEFVQEALPVEAGERDLFVRNSLHCIDGAAAVLLAGSLPPGLPLDFYKLCVQRAVARGLPVVIDAQGLPLLSALPQSAAVVKINREEFEAIRAHIPGTRDTDDALAAELLSLGARCVIVTDGGNPVRVWQGGISTMLPTRAAVLPVPAVRTVNPVGSGDVMSGGITLALARGDSLEEAIHLGIEMATANARTLLPGELS